MTADSSPASVEFGRSTVKLRNGTIIKATSVRTVGAFLEVIGHVGDQHSKRRLLPPRVIEFVREDER